MFFDLFKDYYIISSKQDKQKSLPCGKPKRGRQGGRARPRINFAIRFLN